MSISFGQLHPYGSRGIVSKSFSAFFLLSFLPLLLSNMGSIPGTRELSYGAFALLLLGSLSILLHGWLRKPITEFLFITLQPVSTVLLYCGFVVLFKYIGAAWDLVVLTVLALWSLWLVPVLLPDFSTTYNQEYIKPKSTWAKLLFRYLLIPLFALTPTSAAAYARLSMQLEWMPGVIYGVLVAYLLTFTFQFYLVSSVWPHIAPKSSGQPGDKQ